MVRILAGVGAALLLVAGGAFLWLSPVESSVTPPPAPAAVDRDVAPDTREAPPQASERTREERRFDRYDKDRDERITREEYLRSRRTAYGKLDTNGDGRLTFDEWAVKTTGKFATADGDRDGALSRTEFATTRPVRRTPARRAARCDCPSPAPAGEGDD